MSWLRHGLVIGAIFTALSAHVLADQNFMEVKPSPQQVAWQDLEFGVIIHFSTNTFLDREWGDGTASPAVFNPTQFDPDQWMQAIKASGAKYVVLVAKHHDGFCLWPTAQTDYSVKASPWKDGKGDVVGEVARSARKYGLKFGVYLSPWDRHDPRYSNSEAYDKYYLSELEELAQIMVTWLNSGSTGRGAPDMSITFPGSSRLCAPISPTPSSSPIQACSSTAMRAGPAQNRGASTTRIGTSSTVTATCAGARSRRTRRCVVCIGSGIRATRRL